jgi:uncharacterized membrane protein
MMTLVILLLWSFVGLAISSIIVDKYAVESNSWSGATLFWLVIALGPIVWLMTIYVAVNGVDQDGVDDESN